MNYQRILGITADASPDEIKKAYRKLARKHHPDVNPNDPNAAARFIEVREAYEYALAIKVGGIRPKISPTEFKKYQEAVSNAVEILELNHFISNLELLCLRTVHKEDDQQMRTLVDDYLRWVWRLGLIRKINQHATLRQKDRIIDLTTYLLKMVTPERRINVSNCLIRISKDNASLLKRTEKLKRKSSLQSQLGYYSPALILVVVTYYITYAGFRHFGLAALSAVIVTMIYLLIKRKPKS